MGLATRYRIADILFVFENIIQCFWEALRQRADRRRSAAKQTFLSARVQKSRGKRKLKWHIGCRLLSPPFFDVAFRSTRGDDITRGGKKKVHESFLHQQLLVRFLRRTRSRKSETYTELFV